MTNLLKVHFSMAFLLQICCNSSEQFFIRAAPLCIVVSDFKITVIYIDAEYLDCPNNCWFLDICLLIVCRTKHYSIKGEQNFILFISNRVNIITKSNNINIKDRQYIKNFRKIDFFFEIVYINPLVQCTWIWFTFTGLSFWDFFAWTENI